MLLALAAPVLVAVPGPAVQALTVSDGSRAAASGLVVEVLSNRADLISAGDALVEVELRGVRADQVRVRVGGRDVTRSFAVRKDGRYLGLVRGLELGRNVVTATAGAVTGRAVIVNHPNGGPVFSGPQTRHYRCQETARDDRCNEAPTYTLLYKSSDPTTTDLQPYDEAAPPSDVATTTTDQGVEVPFVVRQESGFQDRDRYTILTLFQPGQPWRAWSPQQQWNHKLVVTHGGGCGASYGPGEPPLLDYSGTFDGVPTGVTPSYVTALGLGFAVLSTALDNTGHNCNVALNAESVMMAKERLVEQYGELRYTIGTGCSGGSIAQHTVANAYPGIYQGLVTTCSYPDVITAGAQFADYHLMRLYFEDPTRWAPGVVWLPTQMAQVEGHATIINSIVADEGLFKAALNAEHDCPGTVAPVAGDVTTRYDSEINPAGVRCSVLDLVVNLLGRRPRSVWTPQEKAVGHGFGGIPFANRGVLYGLNALKTGLITAAQFVDLNVKIGGLDVDSEPTEARIDGDPRSVARAYRTGLVNEANHLDEVAIINHGGPDPGIAHDYAHAFWTEDRMMADQGHTNNRVMWFGPTPLIGDLSWANEALVTMDRWLAAVEQDTSSAPLATKVVTDKPADITDRCLTRAELNTLCSTSELQVLQTRLSTPRQEAGGPATNDILSCRLRPLDPADFDFMLVPFTAAEWATLEGVFPDGVCDWTRRGFGQGPVTTWLRYDAARGGPAYGGRPLPAPPARSGAGLMASSWASMLAVGR
ncbi:MAG: hypothetical protein F2667_09885 [Actinobacteria bacterium]|uniref:Unannotated protein n=1 Tax=freshwater metagenome TaxID=449393 RepID=A0A6J6R975_9ZZZZ|nr:hypothetical protein [Actinomycetota bacterium]